MRSYIKRKKSQTSDVEPSGHIIKYSIIYFILRWSLYTIILRFLKSFQPTTTFHVPITDHLVGNWNVECGLLCYGAQPGLLVFFFWRLWPVLFPETRLFSVYSGGRQLVDQGELAMIWDKNKIAQKPGLQDCIVHRVLFSSGKENLFQTYSIFLSTSFRLAFMFLLMEKLHVCHES